MAIWTVVVGDRPTCAFSAADQTTASAALEEEDGIRVDLMVYEDEHGRPLWDGESALFVRQATPDEYRIWRQAYNEAQDDLDFEGMMDREEPDEWLAFLIPIHDPTDDDISD